MRMSTALDRDSEVGQEGSGAEVYTDAAHPGLGMTVEW